MRKKITALFTSLLLCGVSAYAANKVIVVEFTDVTKSGPQKSSEQLAKCVKYTNSVMYNNERIVEDNMRYEYPVVTDVELIPDSGYAYYFENKYYTEFQHTKIAGWYDYYEYDTVHVNINLTRDKDTLIDIYPKKLFDFGHPTTEGQKVSDFLYKPQPHFELIQESWECASDGTVIDYFECGKSYRYEADLKVLDSVYIVGYGAYYPGSTFHMDYNGTTREWVEGGYWYSDDHPSGVWYDSYVRYEKQYDQIDVLDSAKYVKTVVFNKISSDGRINEFDINKTLYCGGPKVGTEYVMTADQMKDKYLFNSIYYQSGDGDKHFITDTTLYCFKYHSWDDVTYSLVPMGIKCNVNFSIPITEDMLDDTLNVFVVYERDCKHKGDTIDLRNIEKPELFAFRDTSEIVKYGDSLSLYSYYREGIWYQSSDSERYLGGSNSKSIYIQYNPKVCVDESNVVLLLPSWLSENNVKKEVYEEGDIFFCKVNINYDLDGSAYPVKIQPIDVTKSDSINLSAEQMADWFTIDEINDYIVFSINAPNEYSFVGLSDSLGYIDSYDYYNQYENGKGRWWYYGGANSYNVIYPKFTKDRVITERDLKNYFANYRCPVMEGEPVSDYMIDSLPGLTIIRQNWNHYSGYEEPDTFGCGYYIHNIVCTTDNSYLMIRNYGIEFLIGDSIDYSNDVWVRCNNWNDTIYIETQNYRELYMDQSKHLNEIVVYSSYSDGYTDYTYYDQSCKDYHSLYIGTDFEFFVRNIPNNAVEAFYVTENGDSVKIDRKDSYSNYYSFRLTESMAMTTLNVYVKYTDTSIVVTDTLDLRNLIKPVLGEKMPNDTIYFRDNNELRSYCISSGWQNSFGYSDSEFELGNYFMSIHCQLKEGYRIDDVVLLLPDWMQTPYKSINDYGREYNITLSYQLKGTTLRLQDEFVYDSLGCKLYLNGEPFSMKSVAAGDTLVFNLVCNSDTSYKFIGLNLGQGRFYAADTNGVVKIVAFASNQQYNYLPVSLLLGKDCESSDNLVVYGPETACGGFAYDEMYASMGFSSYIWEKDGRVIGTYNSVSPGYLDEGENTFVVTGIDYNGCTKSAEWTITNYDMYIDFQDYVEITADDGDVIVFEDLFKSEKYHIEWGYKDFDTLTFNINEYDDHYYYDYDYHGYGYHSNDYGCEGKFESSVHIRPVVKTIVEIDLEEIGVPEVDEYGWFCMRGHDIKIKTSDGNVYDGTMFMDSCYNKFDNREFGVYLTNGRYNIDPSCVIKNVMFMDSLNYSVSGRYFYMSGNLKFKPKDNVVICDDVYVDSLVNTVVNPADVDIIKLGDSVQTIGPNAFAGLDSLSTIIITAPTLVECDSSTFDGINDCIIYVEENLVDDYKSHPVYGNEDKFTIKPITDDVLNDAGLNESGICDVARDVIDVVGGNNEFVIYNAEGKNAMAYSSLGRNVLNVTCDSNAKVCVISSGVYIVRIENEIFKVLVK